VPADKLVDEALAVGAKIGDVRTFLTRCIHTGLLAP
jgi:hypothetical protein